MLAGQGDEEGGGEVKRRVTTPHSKFLNPTNHNLQAQCNILKSRPAIQMSDAEVD